MDNTRFDDLTRALRDARSRRGALATLLAGALGLLGRADMEARKKRKKKKKKKTTPSPPPPPPPPFTCQGQADGVACGAGQICAQGQCVTGQGSCAPGADFCSGTGTVPCGESCLCWTTEDDQTRCGENISLNGCNECANDADCVAEFPNTPGAFCVQDTGPDCACGGFCVAPCSTACHADADCGAGQICAQGQCVAGQGTCATGADHCLNGNARCGGGSCFCLTTKANKTRCGTNLSCGACTSDANCATLFPDIPGVFCVNDTGPTCGCGSFCIAPCPS